MRIISGPFFKDPTITEGTETSLFPRLAAEPPRAPLPVRPHAEAAGARENLIIVLSTFLLSDLGFNMF